MPKVEINETYKYGQLNSDRLNFTAYIPVMGVLNMSGENIGRVVSEPKLYTSYGQLIGDNYTDISAYTGLKKYDDQELNYIMARKLLEKGLPVVLEGIDKLYNVTKTHTESGSEVEDWIGKLSYLAIQAFTVSDVTTEYYTFKVVECSESEQVDKLYYVIYDSEEPGFINKTSVLYTRDGNTFTAVGNISISTGAYAYSLDKITDKSSYNIRFVTVGTYLDDEDGIRSMIEVAKTRKDAIALIDHPEQITETPSNVSSGVTKQVALVRTYYERILATVTPDDLKYSAGFTPWINVTLNSVKDSQDNEIEVNVPASFGYLSAFIDAIKQNPEWFAIAGSFRGNIKELNKVTYPYTSSEVEVLQARSKIGAVSLDGTNDNVGIAINPISQVIPFGYIINGNRTLFDNPDNFQFSDIDDKAINVMDYRAYLNIRNLVCTLVKQLHYASKKYTFEPNSDITYINFKSETTPLLDRMRSGLGIRGYKFTRLATNAKARIKAVISISPIEAIEDFELGVELDDSLDIIE